MRQGDFVTYFEAFSDQLSAFGFVVHPHQSASNYQFRVKSREWELELQKTGRAYISTAVKSISFNTQS